MKSGIGGNPPKSAACLATGPVETGLRFPLLSGGELCFMLPVYVINLDRRPDRLASISENLERINVAWERVQAIDGMDLQETRWLDRASLACSQSHRKAMRMFLDSSHPAAMILEDDAEVGEDVSAFLSSVDWWPHNHGLLKLDSPRSPRFLGPGYGHAPTGRSLHEIPYWGILATGYLINRNAAEIVLASADCQFFPIDVVMFHLGWSRTARKLRPLWVVPTVIRPHQELGSDIEHYRKAMRRKKERRLEKFIFKVKVTLRRLAGKVRYEQIPYRARMSSQKEIQPKIRDLS